MVTFVQNVGLVINPFIVPEDSWIIKVDFLNPDNDYIKIDGLGGIGITPCQKLLFWSYESPYVYSPVVVHNMNCPYPVKKGQVIEVYDVNKPGTYITFALCMSV